MGIWSWNIKTNKRTFDKKILHLLGIAGNTFKGTPNEFFNAVHPEDRDALEKMLSEGLETKRTISPEYRVVWPDGSIHHLKARAKLIFDAKGSPSKLKGISWDITDQKLIEKELIDKQSQINNFFNNAPDAIIIIDKNSAIHNWNPKAEQIFGWKAEEIIGKSIEQTIIPQIHRKAHFLGMQSYNNTGEGRIINSTIEITAQRKNNEEFPILLSVSKTTVKGIPYFIGFINDITEKKKAENILIESESRFRQISETINDVFYLYNIVEKRYEFISKNCEEVLGASQDFFYSGKKYTETFVVEEDRQKMLEANKLVDSGTPYDVEFRITSKGEVKWIREKSFPIKGKSGKAVKNSGVCTDITHLKFQEFELKTQKRHLETLNDTKDKFFSIVAHDLKSPLNSLKAFTTMLIDHTDHFSKEEIIQTSRQAQLAVDNTIKMADNLITWARLQMNDYETLPEKIYFTEVVATLLPVYKRIAEKKGIILTWSFEDTLTLFADKNHVQFIIRNLINNAIKFTQKAGAIKLNAVSLANGYIQISVSDNGVGISDDMKEKIFSTGKNQSLNGTAGEKGTGLGLMLCYEFIKLNGGMIDVESQLGQGSIFNVQLKSDSDQLKSNRN
ncbi:MAG: PAS domain-containing sensor histidine kinase [Bacteroidetes bacterium]|nr:PAS domain-containing sensor histidine kinase [Bacteroidota bacterium]MBI3481858.1 PAS domain-containing sensor histidine kinase [Bacteroidota bacterium]